MESLFYVAERLQEGWPVKLVSSCVLSIAAEEHVHIFMAFFVLVCVDLLAKLLSLSRQHLMDGGQEAPSLWRALRNVPVARRARYIRSREMREKFVCKIRSYVVVVAAAVLLDFILLKAHAPSFAATVVIGYLALTEFVSVLENLEDAGVEEAGAMADAVRRRGGMVKKEKGGVRDGAAGDKGV